MEDSLITEFLVSILFLVWYGVILAGTIAVLCVPTFYVIMMPELRSIVKDRPGLGCAFNAWQPFLSFGIHDDGVTTEVQMCPRLIYDVSLRPLSFHLVLRIGDVYTLQPRPYVFPMWLRHRVDHELNDAPRGLPWRDQLAVLADLTERLHRLSKEYIP
jgi:hypothetical protein